MLERHTTCCLGGHLATPRKRWFRVADSILRDPLPRDQKLALILLMAHLNTRWARDGIETSEAGKCTLSAGALADITGLKRIRSGFALLSKLSGSVSIAVSLENGFVSVVWPKYAHFQRSPSDVGAESGTEKALSDSDSNPSDKRRPSRHPAGAGVGPPNDNHSAREKPPVSIPAEQFANDFRIAMRQREPDCKLPSPSAYAGWERAADGIFRIDKRDKDEVYDVAQWLFRSSDSGADFWRANIRSVTKFRKQYEVLRARMGSENRKANGTTGKKSGLLQAAQELYDGVESGGRQP